MITALAWIPRGAARSRPVRYELSQEEKQRVVALAAMEQRELDEEDKEQEHTASGASFPKSKGKGKGKGTNADDDEEEDEEGGEGNVALDDEDIKEFGLDGYDEEEEGGAALLGAGDNDDDVDMEDDNNANFELIDQGDQALAVDAESEDDEDAEDNEIRPTDSLFVVAMTDDDDSSLEVQLYSEEGNLYTHHDIFLPDFPLCLAWMDCPPFRVDGAQSGVGNYVAVGTFSPAIEIWNLDVLDPLEPSATLGGMLDKPKKKSKSGKKAKPQFKPGSHTEGVLSLSWNKMARQALASGSADTSLKVWDVTTQQCSHTFTSHKDKVQGVLWHITEAYYLASASFDKTVCVHDCRSGTQALSLAIASDPESMAWDPSEPYHLYCTLEDGSVVAWDMRTAGSKGPLFSFQAHDQTTSSISFCPSIPGMFATSSVDKSIKVWDAKNTAATGVPHLVAYKTMNVGKLFAMQFSHDVPYLMVSGGDDGCVAVWESDEMTHIKNYFASRESSGSTGGLSSVIQNMNIGSSTSTNATSTGVATEASSGDKKAKKNKNKK